MAVEFVHDLNRTHELPSKLTFRSEYVTSWHLGHIEFVTIFVNLGQLHKYKNMDKITQILENVGRCKYFEAGVHIKNPIKNSYQDGLGRTTQTLHHVVVVHISI
jgi:hypothetical protein